MDTDARDLRPSPRRAQLTDFMESFMESEVLPGQAELRRAPALSRNGLVLA
jgi:hypothetical protein